MSVYLSVKARDVPVAICEYGSLLLCCVLGLTYFEHISFFFLTVCVACRGSREKYGL